MAKKPKVSNSKEGDNIPADFFLPQSGIEDIDRAVFNLFDKILNFEVTVNNQTTHVPVVFATGERFALTRRRQPIRDSNNALILPIISVYRQSIDHDPGLGGFGTPISFRDQPNYVVKKRLSSEDRSYQQLINKLKISNQKNVAASANFSSRDVYPGNVASPGTVATRRGKGGSSIVQTPKALLDKNLGDNIFEIITVPYPKFFLLSYEVTFWTQYTSQMNQLLETFMSSFPGQGHDFLVKSDKGYEYVVFVNSPLSTGDNFSEFSNDERIIRYTFGLKVPGYILANQQPGLTLPWRKYLSAPVVEFGYNQISSQVVKPEPPITAAESKKFVLSDTDDVNPDGTRNVSRRDDGTKIVQTIVDPFTGKGSKRLVSVLAADARTGETVSSSLIVVKLESEPD